MTFYHALLLVIGVAMVLLGVMVLLAHMDKKRPVKEYDERQQAVRGRAYEWAFEIGILYFGLVMLLESLLPEGLQASLILVVATGLALEGFTIGAYCEMHDAYLPFAKSRKANIYILYFVGGLQLLNAVLQVRRMRIVLTEEGISKQSFGEVMIGGDEQSAVVWAYLIIAVASVVLATLELVHDIRDKRSES